MYHCFTENIGETSVTITGPDVNHIRNVLRMHEGEDIYVSDGHGRNVLAAISSVTQDEITADILMENAADTELPVDIVLYQGLPKADKMELIIQKCVELGASRIVPVRTSRCIVKLDDRSAAKKVERWQKIAESAAKQSQRGIIPVISPVLSYSDALQDAQKLDTAVIPYEHSSDSHTLLTLLGGSQVRQNSSIGIFIGPEGGFEESEVIKAAQAGIKPVTLGKRILRTETAGMALIAAIMLSIEAYDEQTDQTES